MGTDNWYASPIIGALRVYEREVSGKNGAREIKRTEVIRE